jgi:hypothetical protein
VIDAVQMLEQVIRDSKALVRAAGADKGMLDRRGDVSREHVRQICLVDFPQAGRLLCQKLERATQIARDYGLVEAFGQGGIFLTHEPKLARTKGSSRSSLHSFPSQR